MKKTSLFSSISAVALLCLGLAACGGDDESSVVPVVPQAPVVTSTDPAGTIVVNFQKGGPSNQQSVGVGNIYVDNADNFNFDKGEWNGLYYTNEGIEFASIGKVNGLNEVNYIPSKGWSKSIAVNANTGYLVYRGGFYYGFSDLLDPYGSIGYARLFVSAVSSTGITVKYQYPFITPIKLKQTTLTCTKEGLSVNNNGFYGKVELEFPTSFEFISYPDWCRQLSYSHNAGESYISIYLKSNTTGQRREGEVVIKNDLGEARFTVIQEG